MNNVNTLKVSDKDLLTLFEILDTVNLMLDFFKEFCGTEEGAPVELRSSHKFGAMYTGEVCRLLGELERLTSLKLEFDREAPSPHRATDESDDDAGDGGYQQ